MDWEAAAGRVRQLIPRWKAPSAFFSSFAHDWSWQDLGAVRPRIYVLRRHRSYSKQYTLILCGIYRVEDKRILVDDVD